MARKILFNIFAWMVVLMVAFPLFWMLVTSVKPQFELFRRPPSMLPETVTFEHYWRLLSDTNFLGYFWNSVILSTATTFVVVTIATIGAYSLVRFRYRGRETLAFLVLFTYLLPSVVLILPLYLMLVELGLSNTITSLVIAYTTFALPYALWLLRSFMAGIPEDLESAALVDGATRLGAFKDVILPQLLPGIISTALFTFILSWNEYLYALVLVNSDEVPAADDGRHEHADFVVQYRVVAADGRVGHDERPVDYCFCFLAKLSDPRLRRGRCERIEDGRCRSIKCKQGFRNLYCRRRLEFGHPPGRICLAAGTLGVWQDDNAAYVGRAGVSQRRRNPDWRSGGQRPGPRVSATSRWFSNPTRFIPTCRLVRTLPIR